LQLLGSLIYSVLATFWRDGHCGAL